MEIKLYSPSHPAEVIILLVSAVSWFVLIIATLFMIKNRNYPLIKAKSVWVMTVQVFACICWWLGSAQATWLLPPDTFSQCTFFGVWLQSVFGFLLLANAFIFRLFNMYRIFIKPDMTITSADSTRSNLKLQLVRTVSLYTPSIIMGIILSVFDADSLQLFTVNGGYQQYLCQYSAGWITFLVVVVLLYLIIMLWLIWKLRNVRDSFNEYAENRTAGAMFFFAFITIALTSFLELYYHWAGRVVASFSVTLSCQVYFWTLMREPFSYCYYEPQRGIEIFKAGLSVNAKSKSSGSRKSSIISERKISRKSSPSVSQDATSRHTSEHDAHSKISTAYNSQHDVDMEVGVEVVAE